MNEVDEKTRKEGLRTDGVKLSIYFRKSERVMRNPFKVKL